MPEKLFIRAQPAESEQSQQSARSQQFEPQVGRTSGVQRLQSSLNPLRVLTGKLGKDGHGPRHRPA